MWAVPRRVLFGALTLVVLGILSTYFSSPFLISLRASSPGTKAAGREMEEELATTSLESILNSTSNSPVVLRRLSCQISDNQHEAETSANVNKHWKTRCKGYEVITNVISANEHFASTLSMQIFKFQRRNCKLPFLLPERPGELARRLLLNDPKRPNNNCSIFHLLALSVHIIRPPN